MPGPRAPDSALASGLDRALFARLDRVCAGRARASDEAVPPRVAFTAWAICGIDARRRVVPRDGPVTRHGFRRGSAARRAAPRLSGAVADAVSFDRRNVQARAIATTAVG